MDAGLRSLPRDCRPRADVHHQPSGPRGLAREWGMNLTREAFEADKIRYESDLKSYLDQGLSDDHPLVERARRRIETVDRVLNDPAYGLTEQS
jgi:hypothetical protein